MIFLRPAWGLQLVALVLLLLGGGSALAHKGSDAYLDVRQPIADTAGSAQTPLGQHQAVRFVLSVALRDLDQLVAIDANSDAKLTWGEVKTATPDLLALLNQSANTAPPGGADNNPGAARCRLDWRSDGLERRGDGTYLRAVADAICPPAQPLLLHYTLFREQDATHRLLVSGRVGGVDLLTTTSPQQSAPLELRARSDGAAAGASRAVASRAGRWNALRDYFGLGMQHLLAGYDHLAFLLALVLPLRLVLGSSANAAVASGQRPGASSWWALLRTVTAFTLGHSVTLVLATLGWTELSPAWVEPVIALSIIATAALNLRPLPWLRVEWLALGFGMVHGYGFAGLLLETAAPSGLLPWALAGFNLGVEAGQLLAVLGWALLVQVVVRRSWYEGVVVRGGSVLLMALAALWFWQRVA